MSEVPPPPVATIPPAVPPPPLPSTCPVSYDLRDKELLSLLLAPNLEESLTPGTLIGADNVALFRLLPLILAAIHHLGRSSSHRSSFVSLISVLRCRIVACRGLKLRFLLLLKNPAFSQHWHVKMVHRRDCYTSAHHVLQDMAHDMDKQKQSSLSLALALQIPKMKSASSRLIQDWLKDKAMVIAFVARKLLHPHLGIYTRPLMWHMRPVKAGFYATELVDGIMERANFHDRNDAIQLAQRLLDMRIILKMGGKGKKFVDDKRRIYQSCFTLQQKDNGHCRVVMECGKEVCSWDVLGGMDDRVVIKHIEVQMPMDMIDLQSYEFWTNSVYVKNVKSGHRYGYRAITHPMFCGDVKPGCTAPENSKIILENDGSGYSDSNASDEGLSFSLLSASQLSGLSLDEVNLIHQDTSVIGSVVVRKVFSSIARPMIIELRLPLENAELEDDDQHVTMRPGLLVKEGDNLMQDLGVEIMFQCFNYVWNQSTSLKDEYGMTPFSISYEVFPTSPTQGFMEGVTGLTSLKEFNWKKWHNEYGKDKNRVNDMLRSAVGSYIGAYVVG